MITHAFANALINVASGRSLSLAYGTIYLGLSKTAPNPDGTGVTEPSGNNYARILLGKYDEPSSLKMNAAASGEAKNGAQIAFNKATGAWGTCTHACLYAGSTLIWYGALTASISPVAGEVALIEANNLTISID